MADKRKRTNVACTFIFLISIFICWAIDAYAFLNGDLGMLFGAMDGNRNQCGISAGYEEYPYLFINLLQDFGDKDQSNIFKKAVCVNKCPTAANDTIKCKPTSHQPDCPKSGTLYPSLAWFGECAPVQNDAMSAWTADAKLGYAYLEQNHDKHYSFLLDFINNGL